MRLKLHSLLKSASKKRKKRLGSGPGSGRGKTSGRGVKGQKSRSGSSIPLHFEGGQTPLARKLPYKKGRGFTNYNFKTLYSTLNFVDLNKLDKSITDVDISVLIREGLLKKNVLQVKILAKGELNRPLNLTVDKISASAKSKIEAMGGKVHIIE